MTLIVEHVAIALYELDCAKTSDRGPWLDLSPETRAVYESDAVSLIESLSSAGAVILFPALLPEPTP